MLSKIDFGKILNIFFFLSLGIAILASIMRYMVVKDFIVHIETPCDPELELCFYRDCETDDCPSNNLSNYRTFELPGYEFAQCINTDGCEYVCRNFDNVCVETVCNPEENLCSTKK